MVINTDKELEFYFFLLLNTCHDCFAETKIKENKKDFKLRVMPQDILKETIEVKPYNPILDNLSIKKFKNRFLTSQGKSIKSLLDDVPRNKNDSSASNQDHYIYNESNFLIIINF